MKKLLDVRVSVKMVFDLHYIKASKGSKGSKGIMLIIVTYNYYRITFSFTIHIFYTVFVPHLEILCSALLYIYFKTENRTEIKLTSAKVKT